MSATLDYAIKKALPFLTKDNRWNVLTVLILHANVRNRCWPSIQTIADMATNGNRNRATRAKNWLQKHSAFTIVPNDKRVEEEMHLNGKQLVYQLTGVVKTCGDVKCHCNGYDAMYSYLYKTNQNGDAYSIQTDTTDDRSIQMDTTHNTNGDTTRSMNGGTRSISIEVSPLEVLDAEKPRHKIDPEFDVIAKVFQANAGGYIANMQGMIFGSKQVKGQWKLAKFDPPATVAEVEAFEEYLHRRMNEKRLTEIPSAAVTIQRWFYDFRAEVAKRATAASNIIPLDLSQWETPELESA